MDRSRSSKAVTVCWFMEVSRVPIVRSKDPIARSKGSCHHLRACVRVKGDALSQGIKDRKYSVAALDGIAYGTDTRYSNMKVRLYKRLVAPKHCLEHYIAMPVIQRNCI